MCLIQIRIQHFKYLLDIITVGTVTGTVPEPFFFVFSETKVKNQPEIIIMQD